MYLVNFVVHALSGLTINCILQDEITTDSSTCGSWDMTLPPLL